MEATACGAYTVAGTDNEPEAKLALSLTLTLTLARYGQRARGQVLLRVRQQALTPTLTLAPSSKPLTLP